MKKLLQRLEFFFINLFSKEYAFLKKNSRLAVDVTNMLKSLVESPVTTLVTNLIPGEVDNEVLAKLRAIVPKVTTEVALAHGIIQQATSNADVLGAIIEHLKTKHPDARVGFWLELSGRINQALADGKISFSEAVALAQVVYAQLAKPKS